ncbi:MAG: hypothetical protein U5N10_04680 [Gemmobacter sp.]|nr:hypothetical protein [Gemmobacter sp.]
MNKAPNIRAKRLFTLGKLFPQPCGCRIAAMRRTGIVQTQQLPQIDLNEATDGSADDPEAQMKKIKG